MLEDLYQQVILDSSRNPRNRGDLAGNSSAAHELVTNPLCGDTVDLWVELSAGRISEVKFSGSGCTISQASASLMSDLVVGKTLAEARGLIADFQALLAGAPDEDVKDRLGQMVALEGVKKFPVRMRCAMLSFEALNRLLKRLGA
ncbi:MAG: SUF system NifU family Fe-S cluster assembly protein [Bdellovibrionota bacterium]